MESFLVYILKSAGVLSIFYVAYILLLKNDTSFEQNRKFLLGGIFAALILPSVYFTKTVLLEVPAQPSPEIQNSEIITAALDQGPDWWLHTGLLYSVIFGVLFIKFIIQFYKIISVLYSLPKQTSGKFIIARSKEVTGPFSFFNYIVFNPEMHSQKELKFILKHEMVHAEQGHTVDLLLSHLITCLLWFNPFTWAYKKSIVQNLEFIADKETLSAFTNKKDYQQTLLKISLGDLQPALSNSFYKSFIKKRILMLNKNKTSTGFLWKISLVFPAILAFMLIFNVQTKVYSQEKTTMITTLMEVFIDFDKTTTREDLDGYTALMAEYDVILKFKDIQYNKDGLLTNIQVEFIDKTNVSSGSVTKSNTGGVESFRYVYNPEEGSRFTSPKAHTPVKSNTVNVKKTVFKTSPEDSTKISFEMQGAVTEPLYVINGKVLGNATTVKAIDTNNITSINVIKGQSAVSLYGDAAKAGAIIITTNKQGETTSSKNNTFERTRVMQDSAVSNRTYFINKSRFVKDSLNGRSRIFNGNTEVLAPQGTSQQNRKSIIISNNKNNNYDKPLILVDGEEKPVNFNMTSIDQSKIKNIHIIKSDESVKKYGEKATGGAIEISLKTNK